VLDGLETQDRVNYAPGMAVSNRLSGPHQLSRPDWRILSARILPILIDTSAQTAQAIFLFEEELRSSPVRGAKIQRGAAPGNVASRSRP
jgi:hypothetical protein